MMKKTFSVFATLVFSRCLLQARAAPLADEYVSQYSGTKVLRVPTSSDASVAALEDLIASLQVQKWTTVPKANSFVDVQVGKAQLGAFAEGVQKVMGEFQVQGEVVTMHEDLGESVQAEREDMLNASEFDKRAGLAVDAWFNAYHSYADHLTFLNDLVATYPQNSKIVTTGTSLQGRAITGVHIFGSGGAGSKPAIVLHGTVHAREWIASMVTEQLAFSLLANYTTSTTIKSYVDKYDFYLFPIVNPDGFVYTQTTDRLWRKNRTPPPSGSTCYGTDINRNWAHSSWGQADGASTSPCSETYKGPSAASSVETQGLQAFILARANSAAGMKMYLDIHSYGNLMLTPYDSSCTAIPPDDVELTSLAAGYGRALTAVYGTKMTTGPSCRTLYAVSGGSMDYSYDNGRVKYSFASELRDTGATGFLLPASQIKASGIENYAALQYLLANMK